MVGRDVVHGGEVRPERRSVRDRVPRPAVRDGIVYVTEDRKLDGFFETMSIAENIDLNDLAADLDEGLVVGVPEMATLAKTWTDRLAVKATGGKQRQVVIDRSLVPRPKLAIVDEPTRGVAVVVISSDLPEILDLADRIRVSRQGRIVEAFPIEDATESKFYVRGRPLRAGAARRGPRDKG